MLGRAQLKDLEQELVETRQDALSAYKSMSISREYYGVSSYPASSLSSLPQALYLLMRGPTSLPLLTLGLTCLTALTQALPTDSVVYDHLKRQQLAQVITTCTTPNTIALTFDDGPYIYSRELVDLLDQNGIKGTFFYNGNNWRCIYDSDMMANVKYTYSHGHQVASHTWHHYDLSTLTWDQIHDEMWRVELALTRIVGAYPAFMRPPYGSYNNLVRQASAVRGQK